MKKLARPPFTALLLVTVAFTTAGCSSAPASDRRVAFYNAFRTGSEALPTAIPGCESLGSVSASLPEPSGTTISFADPKPLLETLELRARRKGADTAVVLLQSGQLQGGSRSLRATIFRCGSTPVPESVGAPIR